MLLSKKGEARNLNAWINDNETSERGIDYIAFSNERRKWVTTAQTKGDANRDSPLQRKTIQVDIKYDIVRTKKRNSGNKHIDFDIKQLRGHATMIRRNPTETKIQKLIQISDANYKINQPRQQTPEQEQKAADEITGWGNKTWLKVAGILRNIQQHEFPINVQTKQKYIIPKYPQAEKKPRNN